MCTSFCVGTVCFAARMLKSRFLTRGSGCLDAIWRIVSKSDSVGLIQISDSALCCTSVVAILKSSSSNSLLRNSPLQTFSSSKPYKAMLQSRTICLSRNPGLRLRSRRTKLVALASQAHRSSVLPPLLRVSLASSSLESMIATSSCPSAKATASGTIERFLHVHYQQR
jgi:hypothetical protein